MIIGYARVLTISQSLHAQIDSLSKAGVERIFSETVSGVKAKRPELARMLDQLCNGDVVMVTKYDRLARSLSSLLDIVEAIKKRGAGFRSLAEDIDTITPAGELIFHVFASIAHFERRRITENTRKGLAVARSKAALVAAPLALSTDQKAEVLRMRDEDSRPLREIACLFKVSVQTVRRV